jgi:hypothetical protein
VVLAVFAAGCDPMAVRIPGLCGPLRDPGDDDPGDDDPGDDDPGDDDPGDDDPGDDFPGDDFHAWCVTISSRSGD